MWPGNWDPIMGMAFCHMKVGHPWSRHSLNPPVKAQVPWQYQMAFHQCPSMVMTVFLGGGFQVHSRFCSMSSPSLMRSQIHSSLSSVVCDWTCYSTSHMCSSISAKPSLPASCIELCLKDCHEWKKIENLLTTVSSNSKGSCKLYDNVLETHRNMVCCILFVSPFTSLPFQCMLTGIK